MGIRLYNSMSGKLEQFVPQDPNRVTMYVCGSTVYAIPHLGNLRGPVVFDVLFRLLRHVYGADHVEYATNYTDIDDKIIRIAEEQKVDMQYVTQPIIDEIELFSAKMFLLRPNYRPRATAHVNDMIAMISKLIEKGHAYVGKDSVYFSVESSKIKGFQDNRNEDSPPDNDIDKLKRKDFALWKFAKEGEPYWESPWGNGRPGWHIECSAMIQKVFGETIDIHGGGTDLEFPHHEAEHRQSHSHNDKPLANIWMHNGLLRVGGSKMAKSSGSSMRVDKLLKNYNPEVIRYALLRTHYRGDIQFTEYLATDNKTALDQWYSVLWINRDKTVNPSDPLPAVVKALSSDLNTVEALRLITEAAKQLKREFDQSLFDAFVASAKLMGFFNFSVEQWYHYGVDEVELNRLLNLRNSYKEDMNWAEADQVREMASIRYNIQIQDTSEGVFWQTIHGPIL